MNTSQLFTYESACGKVLARWWNDLAQNPGDRAELRRTRSVEAAAILPPTIYLVSRLHSTEVKNHGGWQARIPLIAGLSARLDPNEKNFILEGATSIPELMTKKKGDRPVVSPLRFRRLLRTPRNELYRPMIRILDLLDNRVNLFELADAMFWWGPRIQREWAYTYFPNVSENQLT